MNVKLLILTGAALLSLVFGSVEAAAVLPGWVAEASSAAGAAADVIAQRVAGPRTPGRQGARIYGLVDEIDGSTLTLSTPAGPIALVTDANTIFRIPGVESASLDDLALGDLVGAAGWWDGEARAFHAFGVAKLENDRLLPLAGKLTAVEEDTLTVEVPRYGSAAVRVDQETAYRVKGVEEAGLDDLVVGMKIAARGTLNADGSLQAQVVGAAEPGLRRVRLQGEVTAVEADTFTVRNARGRHVTVLTDEETEFHVPGVETPSIADLQVGDRIAGEGVVGEGGEEGQGPIVRATLVVVLPEEAARLTGEVTAVEGDVVSLETRGGTVQVLTDAETVVRIPGIEQPTVADIEIGDQVVVGGTWEDVGTFHALGIGVVDGRRPGQRGAVGGRVVSVGADSLAVGTPHGPVTVLVGPETRYRMPGVEDAGLDDIEEGMLVGARGTWNENGALQAEGVGVLTR